MRRERGIDQKRILKDWDEGGWDEEEENIGGEDWEKG